MRAITQPSTGTSGAWRAADTGHPVRGVVDPGGTAESALDSGSGASITARPPPTASHPTLTVHPLMAAPVATWIAGIG